MNLNVKKIKEARDDGELLKLLSAALAEVLPAKIQNNRDQFLFSLASMPRGLRAMAGIHDLDVSMALDDLAWHFGNHNDERFLQETELGLMELGATEAADLFRAARKIMEPHLSEIRDKDWEPEDFHDYLERTGLQSRVDPLNEKMWSICEKCGDNGLLQYWVSYAHKYPERCVIQDGREGL